MGLSIWGVMGLWEVGGTRKTSATVSCDSNTVIVAGAPTLFHGFNSSTIIIIYMTIPKFFFFNFSNEMESSNCLCKFLLFQKQPLGGAENPIQETGQ